MENTQENNSLIAEFMGWIKTDKDLVFNSQIHGSNNNSVFSGWIKKEEPYTKGVPLFVVKANRSTGVEYLKKLQYNTSWDWLMPVVEKIEELGYFCMINKWTSVYTGSDGERIQLTTVDGKSKIENTYKAVVEFIKWYNQQK